MRIPQPFDAMRIGLTLLTFAFGLSSLRNELIPVAQAQSVPKSLEQGGSDAGPPCVDLNSPGTLTIATRVAVFTDPPSGEDHEFIRRGLPYEDASAKQTAITCASSPL